MNAIDFLTKEFVKSFEYTNFNKDRHVYYVDGYGNFLGNIEYAASSFVGNLYKTDDNKYLLIVGMDRQNHKNPIMFDVDESFEIAATRAFEKPIVYGELDKEIDERFFIEYCENIINNIPIRWIE